MVVAKTFPCFLKLGQNLLTDSLLLKHDIFTQEERTPNLVYHLTVHY